MPSVKYTAYFETGERISGVTDKNGYYEINDPPSDIVNLVFDDEAVKVKNESIFDYLDAPINVGNKERK